MTRYVCDLEDDTSWDLSPEEVDARTFTTEEEAKQWFKNKYSGESIYFSGFYLTDNYITNWVSQNGKDIGEIIHYGEFTECK